MELRITYRSEIYIQGDDIADIKSKFEETDLYAETEHGKPDFVELVSVERVDDESYQDLLSKFKNA